LNIVMEKFILAYGIRGIIIINMVIGNLLMLFFWVESINFGILPLLLITNFAAFCVLYSCLFYIKNSKHSSWNNAEYFLSGFFATGFVVYFSTYFNFAFAGIMSGAFIEGIFSSFLTALLSMPIVLLQFPAILLFAIFNGFVFMRYGKSLKAPPQSPPR